MQNLPPLFLKRMQELLGEEYPAFLQSYDSPRRYGLRVNTLKISVEEFLRIAPFHLRPVPWTNNGFYYEEEDRPSRHPFYYAGLYYLQEPSAMAPAQILPVHPGERVLDLCAAPGGKATELAAKLTGEGLLVANDISASRAKGLLKNLELFGVSNSFVTCTTPEKLAGQFGKGFDKILVDAPCSGEGMFRKDEASARAWSLEKVQTYAGTQKEIILQAASMLKPGGEMLYSTCTFSPEEDEQVIADLLRNCPEMQLMPIPMTEGFSRGRADLAGEFLSDKERESLSNCVRIYPHKAAGEGHFLALLKKREEKDGRSDQPSEKVTEKAAKRKHGGHIKRTWPGREEMDEFFEDVLKEEIFAERKKKADDRLLSGSPVVEIYNGQTYYMPEETFSGSGIRFLRGGLYLGEIRGNRFEPSQALAMALKKSDCRAVLSLESKDDRVRRYLCGETIDLSDFENAGEEKGWQLVCVDGYPLGWGKLSGGRLKNKYLAGWRMQPRG